MLFSIRILCTWCALQLLSATANPKEQLKDWIEEGRNDEFHDSHNMVDGKIPFQVALDGQDRYVYIPETRQICKATIGSEIEQELEAGMIARALVIVAKEFDKKALNKNWQTDFNQNSIIRELRVPLGHTSKTFRRKGETDTYGHVLSKDKEAYYYNSLDGL